MTGNFCIRGLRVARLLTLLSSELTAKIETETGLAVTVAQVKEMSESIVAREASEAETHASLKEAQEQIRSLQETFEGLQATEKDSESTVTKLQDLETQATELKQLLQTLRDHLRGLEHTQSQQRENAVGLEVLDELEALITSQNDRIQKLEKVKLTKQKVSYIRTLQVSLWIWIALLPLNFLIMAVLTLFISFPQADNIQFQEQVEQYRLKLAAANKTISDLQAKVASVSREVSLG
jgi:myosin heavy subunit